MKTLRIVWIVVIVLFLPLAVTGFFSHSQHLKEKEKINNQINTLKIKIGKLKKQDPAFEKMKGNGRIALKDLYITKDNWWYLGELEGIKKKFQPNFRNISASKIIDNKNFTTLSRKIKMSSSFSEAVDLLDNLEFSEGFQINGLKIHTNGQDSQKHAVEFWMNFSRVKKDVVDKLASALTGETPRRRDNKYYEKSLRLKPVWTKNRRLVLKRRGRDPFIDLKKRRDEWLAILEAEHANKEKTDLTKQIAGSLDPSQQHVDFSDKLILKGVLAIKGIKMAILDAKYTVTPGQKNLYRYNVKIGDLVGEKKVVSIDHKHVVLKHNEMTYFSAMH